jgi:alpha-ketoglutarate-dependent taurine dioxygenase
MVQSVDAEPERYKGRPLLIILENYILDCIGALEPERQQQVRAVVQRTFGGGTDWHQTVRGVLHLGESLDEQLRRMWQQNQEIAMANETVLHPAQFAKMVADQNFAHLMEPTGPDGRA